MEIKREEETQKKEKKNTCTFPVENSRTQSDKWIFYLYLFLEIQ